MSEIPHKRKRKMNFLQKAKKFGRQGDYGQGKQLSQEEYHYYIRILEQLKAVENEEKDILIKNFYLEIQKGEGIKSFATNQIVSRILEDTLPLASISNFIVIMEASLEDLRIFCLDPFASHVLQTLLVLSLKYYQDTPHSESEDAEESKENSKQISLSQEQKEQFKDFIFKISKFVYNNLAEFVCENYASHVVRSVLEVCSGVEVPNTLKSSQKAQTVHSIRDNSKQRVVVPDEFQQLVGEYGVRLSKLPNFTDVIYSDSGSAVLQVTLFVLSALEKNVLASTLVEHIITHGLKAMESDSHEETSDIHPLFQYNSTTRLMEILVLAASETQQEQIFKEFFQNHMSEIVKHRQGNFAVQKLLTSWKSKKNFSPVFESVSECLEGAYSVGYTGVLLAFVKACRSLRSHGSACCKRLMNLLGCSDSDSTRLKMSTVLLYLIPLKEYEAQEQSSELRRTSLHGTLILEELLLFKKNTLVVESILEMPQTELVKMTCDMRGSHIIDFFTTSPHVGEANKEKLLNRLEGHFTTMACSQYGSRSLEAFWAVVGVKTRTKICEELVASSSKLKESKFGSIIYSKFQLRFFNKNEKKGWKELQKKELDRVQSLKKLLQESEEITSEPPKKKNKRS